MGFNFLAGSSSYKAADQAVPAISAAEGACANLDRTAQDIPSNNLTDQKTRSYPLKESEDKLGNHFSSSL